LANFINGLWQHLANVTPSYDNTWQMSLAELWHYLTMSSELWQHSMVNVTLSYDNTWQMSLAELWHYFTMSSELWQHLVNDTLNYDNNVATYRKPWQIPRVWANGVANGVASRHGRQIQMSCLETVSPASGGLAYIVPTIM
jgi:hypothetical protein